jgi:hypothetical protein
MVKRFFIVAGLAAPLVMLACSEDAVPPTGTPDTPQIRASRASADAAQDVDIEQYFLDGMASVNAALAAAGSDYRVGMAEVLTNGDGQQAGLRLSPRMSATSSSPAISFPSIRDGRARPSRMGDGVGRLPGRTTILRMPLI